MIFAQKQFLGASPDLEVNCECHGRGVCEIKCPYSIKSEVSSFDNLVDIDGQSRLKRNSDYHFHIQFRMGVLGVQYGDFFVYTAKCSHLERIEFDADLFNEIVLRAEYLWMNFVGPELVSRSMVSCSSGSVDDHTYAKHQGSEASLPSVSLQSKRGVLTESPFHSSMFAVFVGKMSEKDLFIVKRVE